MELFKIFLNNNFYYRPFFNPFIRLLISSFGSEFGVNNCKRETPLIVSLSSNEDNFNKLPITLYSLLNQELKPDRIILWLDENKYDLTTLPYDITQFIKNGLEIRFVKDFKSYTNSYYAFKEFPTAIIVTASDEIYYPKSWLKKLYLSYISDQENIHVHQADKVNIDTPYEKWEHSIKEENAKFENLPISEGGILYPPNCFSKEALREDIFLKNASDGDNIWYWTMALVHNRKIRVVKNHIKTILTTNILKIFKNKNKTYDEQLNRLIKFYGQNINTKLRREG